MEPECPFQTQMVRSTGSVRHCGSCFNSHGEAAAGVLLIWDYPQPLPHPPTHPRVPCLGISTLTHTTAFALVHHSHPQYLWAACSPFFNVPSPLHYDWLPFLGIFVFLSSVQWSGPHTAATTLYPISCLIYSCLLNTVLTQREMTDFTIGVFHWPKAGILESVFHRCALRIWNITYCGISYACSFALRFHAGYF